MTKLLGNTKPSPEALATMRERGGEWFCYQNHALDSAGLGDCQFLQCGPGHTYQTPPERYPDTRFGTGWRHLLVGVVNLETGYIEEAQ